MDIYHLYTLLYPAIFLLLFLFAVDVPPLFPIHTDLGRSFPTVNKHRAITTYPVHTDKGLWKCPELESGLAAHSSAFSVLTPFYALARSAISPWLRAGGFEPLDRLSSDICLYTLRHHFHSPYRQGHALPTYADGVGGS